LCIGLFWWTIFDIVVTPHWSAALVRRLFGASRQAFGALRREVFTLISCIVSHLLPSDAQWCLVTHEWFWFRFSPPYVVWPFETWSPVQAAGAPEDVFGGSELAREVHAELRLEGPWWAVI